MKRLASLLPAPFVLAAALSSVPALAFDLEDYAITYRQTRDAYLKARNEEALATGIYLAFRPYAVAAGCPTSDVHDRGSAIYRERPTVNVRIETVHDSVRAHGPRWLRSASCLDQLQTGGGTLVGTVAPRAAVNRLIATGYLPSALASQLLADVDRYEAIGRPIGTVNPSEGTNMDAILADKIFPLVPGSPLPDWMKTPACSSPDVNGAGDFCTTHRATRDAMLKASNELRLATGPMMAALDAYGTATATYYTNSQCAGYLLPSGAQFPASEMGSSSCYESRDAFCARLSKSCGTWTDTDACGNYLTHDCGGCSGPWGIGSGYCNNGTCESGGATCVPESDAAYCARMGNTCGNVESVQDNCGQYRAVVNCGTCSTGYCLQNNTCSDACTSYPCITASGEGNGSASAAFDGANYSSWISAWNEGTSAWLAYEFSAPTTVTRYSVDYANPYGQFMDFRWGPRDWTLQGWSGSAWVDLHAVTGETCWGNPAGRPEGLPALHCAGVSPGPRWFTVSAPGSYQQYRLLFTADNWGESHLVQVGVTEAVLADDNGSLTGN